MVRFSRFRRRRWKILLFSVLFVMFLRRLFFHQGTTKEKKPSKFHELESGLQLQPPIVREDVYDEITEKNVIASVTIMRTEKGTPRHIQHNNTLHRPKRKEKKRRKFHKLQSRLQLQPPIVREDVYDKITEKKFIENVTIMTTEKRIPRHIQHNNTLHRPPHVQTTKNSSIDIVLGNQSQVQTASDTQTVQTPRHIHIQHNNTPHRPLHVQIMKNSSVDIVRGNQSQVQIASSNRTSFKESVKTFLVNKNASSNSSNATWKNITSVITHSNQSKDFDDLSSTDLPPYNDSTEQQSSNTTSSLFDASWMDKLNDVQDGKWRPPNSLPIPSEKVAILVPYRYRKEHLKMFLLIMHPFLQRQGVEYGIYVIEQHGDEPMFCKGLLYNIGYMLALKDEGYDCFIFHDVDLIPERDENVYSCKGSPRHLSVAIDVYNYTLPYEHFLGGVVALSAAQYDRLNGYSNLFCGWGGEDDDLFMRLYSHRLTLSRPEEDIGRYRMMRHEKTPENPERLALLKLWDLRAARDGLNSLEQQRKRFKITSVTREWLYTRILVDVDIRGKS
ncbi:uncharacterized protein LOC144919644 [Branchiostoma floridae x Branchiostoma belcheri]